MTANSYIAKSLKCVPYVTEFRFGWQFNCYQSQGVDIFVREFLPSIRANNPHVNFWLYRSPLRCDPHVICCYEYGRTKRKRLSYYTPNQILAMVQEMAIGGDFRPGRRRGIQTRIPRCQKVFETEQKGMDVFKIHSKLNQ